MKKILSKSNFGFSGLGTTSSVAQHVSSPRAAFGSASGGTGMTHAHRPGSEGFSELFPYFHSLFNFSFWISSFLFLKVKNIRLLTEKEDLMV